MEGGSRVMYTISTYGLLGARPAPRARGGAWQVRVILHTG